MPTVHQLRMEQPQIQHFLTAISGKQKRMIFSIKGERMSRITSNVAPGLVDKPSME
jgi:hypothetical protein